jgi:hypothetical protein
MVEKAASRFMSVSFSMDGKPYDAMPMVGAITQRSMPSRQMRPGANIRGIMLHFVSRSQSGTVMDEYITIDSLR